MVQSYKVNYAVQVENTLINWIILNSQSEHSILVGTLFFLKKVGQSRPLFVYFRSFQTQYDRKTVGVSRIRTRNVGVEGEHADHLTTTTAQENFFERLGIGIRST